MRMHQIENLRTHVMPASHKKTLSPSALASLGRPCLLTKDREAKLLKAIEEGMPLKQSAMLAGICYETMNRWRKNGESESARPEFRQFCQALERSQAIAMQLLVERVSQAGKNDWRASAWMLERRYPEEFGKPDERQKEGPQGRVVITDVDCEVLSRIKKQEGIKEAVGRFAEIVARIQERKKNGTRLRE